MLRAGITARLLASFALLGVLAIHPVADADATNVGELWRSQTRLGKQAALLNLKGWKHDAKRRGISLRKLAKELREKALKKVVPVYKAPDGALLQLDKHNGVWSYALLQRKTGRKMAVTTKIQFDGSGMPDEEFADTFFNKHGKGRVDAKDEDKTAVEKMKILRRRKTSKVGNDTLRSTIDTAFERLKLEGEMFKDYVEIDIGKMLRKDGIFKQMRQAGVLAKGDKEIPKDKVFKGKVVKFVASRLREADLREFLIAHARTPDQVPKIEALLAP